MTVDKENGEAYKVFGVLMGQGESAQKTEDFELDKIEKAISGGKDINTSDISDLILIPEDACRIAFAYFTSGGGEYLILRSGAPEQTGLNTYTVYKAEDVISALSKSLDSQANPYANGSKDSGSASSAENEPASHAALYLVLALAGMLLILGIVMALWVRKGRRIKA